MLNMFYYCLYKIKGFFINNNGVLLKKNIVYVLIVVMLWYFFYFTRDSNIRLFRYLLLVENYNYPKGMHFIEILVKLFSNITYNIIKFYEFLFSVKLPKAQNYKNKIEDDFSRFEILIPIIQ